MIGSGPAGQKGAIAAAKLGKRVVMVDRQAALGGVCLHTGTIPSKTLREAILYLSGLRLRTFYGPDYALKRQIRIEDLRLRVDQVVARQRGVVRDLIQRSRGDPPWTLRLMACGPKSYTGPPCMRSNIAPATGPARRGEAGLL